MSDSTGVSLKVMINRERTKVLFAEADSDFADVLLSFLTLPLGRIAKLLEKHYGENSPVFGCITSLYRGLLNLDDVHFTSSVSKKMLLEATSASDSVCRNLKLDIADSQPVKYYNCGNNDCNRRHEILYMYNGANNVRCSYGHPLNHEVIVGGNNYNAEEGLFMIKSSTFIISDDLVMQPYSTGFLEALSNLGITGADGDAAELRNLTLGTTDEVMDLFKCFFLSKTPLTDFILNKGDIMFPSEFSASNFEIQETSDSDKKIVLKMMVHKSTKKVLFAQAEDDFVELLFTFLIIPLGGLQSLTNSHTGHKNLDNLHRSISDVINTNYFVSQDAKRRLINPNIPYFFKPKNTLLPLNEETAPTLYYRYLYNPKFAQRLDFSHKPNSNYEAITLMSPKGKAGYVKKPTAYMVTDDLTVTPFHFTSIFSILSRLNISLSEVEELEMTIGLQEGLSILKAALTSTSALTNGLMDRITMKKPKQEH